MIREIKFRGKVAGQWKYVTPDNQYLWAKFWAVVDRETVGEYIGLSDKAGIKIYEGDIVRVNGGEGDLEFISQVIFERASFRIAAAYDQGFPHKEDVEIIGNIYDNPELLKESQ